MSIKTIAKHQPEIEAARLLLQEFASSVPKSVQKKMYQSHIDSILKRNAAKLEYMQTTHGKYKVTTAKRNPKLNMYQKYMENKPSFSQYISTYYRYDIMLLLLQTEYAAWFTFDSKANIAYILDVPVNHISTILNSIKRTLSSNRVSKSKDLCNEYKLAVEDYITATDSSPYTELNIAENTSYC